MQKYFFFTKLNIYKKDLFIIILYYYHKKAGNKLLPALSRVGDSNPRPTHYE